MYRFLFVRGIKGELVPNPHIDASARRFLGKSPSGVFWDEGPPDKDGKAIYPAAKVIEEIVQDDVSIQKAAKKGSIQILETVCARTMDEARKQLLAEKAPAVAEK